MNQETALERADNFAPADLRAVPGGAPITLFRSDDPDEIIARSTRVATALAKVIKDRKLASLIPCRDHKNASEEARRACPKCREHVRVEGWSLLGTMLGVYPLCAWSRPLLRSISDPKPYGWEARVEARTRSGDLVGAAEGQCTRDESAWGYRDDYALRSMAQTRATSKALRLPLGFVMSLAGFDPTPAEEVPAGGFDEVDAAAPAARGNTGQATKKQRGYIKGLLVAVRQVPGDDKEAILAALNHELGAISATPIRESSELTYALASRLIESLKAAQSAQKRAEDPAGEAVIDGLGEPVKDAVTGEENAAVHEAREAQERAAEKEARGQDEPPPSATDEDFELIAEETAARPAAAAELSKDGTKRAIEMLAEALREHAGRAALLAPDGRVAVTQDFAARVGIAEGFYTVEALAGLGPAKVMAVTSYLTMTADAKNAKAKVTA